MRPGDRYQRQSFIRWLNNIESADPLKEVDFLTRRLKQDTLVQTRSAHAIGQNFLAFGHEGLKLLVKT